MREICARPARGGELLVMRRSGFEFSKSPLQRAKVRSGASVGARAQTCLVGSQPGSGLGADAGLAGLGLVPQWPVAWLVMVIFRIWPSPGAGPPKPRLDTYSAPSGPRVIAVGNDNPVAITVWAPEGSIRTTRPVPSST